MPDKKLLKEQTDVEDRCRSPATNRQCNWLLVAVLVTVCFVVTFTCYQQVCIKDLERNAQHHRRRMDELQHELELVADRLSSLQRAWSGTGHRQAREVTARWTNLQEQIEPERSDRRETRRVSAKVKLIAFGVNPRVQ